MGIDRQRLKEALRHRDNAAVVDELSHAVAADLAGDFDLVEAAAANCSPERMREFVADGLDLDARDRFGRTFLVRRLDRFPRQGEAFDILRTVEVLTELGADLGARDEDGRTAADLLAANLEGYTSPNPARAAEGPQLLAALEALRDAAATSGPNPWSQGLTARGAAFHRNTMKALSEMIAAVGVSSPAALGPHHMARRAPIPSPPPLEPGTGRWRSGLGRDMISP